MEQLRHVAVTQLIRGLATTFWGKYNSITSFEAQERENRHRDHKQRVQVQKHTVAEPMP